MVTKQTLSKGFSTAVFARRQKMHLTQADTAEKAGIGLATFKRIEAGTHEARLDTVEKIAKALGVSASELLK